MGTNGKNANFSLSCAFGSVRFDLFVHFIYFFFRSHWMSVCGWIWKHNSFFSLFFPLFIVVVVHSETLSLSLQYNRLLLFQSSSMTPIQFQPANNNTNNKTFGPRIYAITHTHIKKRSINHSYFLPNKKIQPNWIDELTTTKIYNKNTSNEKKMVMIKTWV